MKVYVNDPFDLRLFRRGLVVQQGDTFYDFYEFAFHFTFKRVMRDYKNEFRDPYENFIGDDAFFEDINDAMVQRCISVQYSIVACRNQLVLNLGMDEGDDLYNEVIAAQATRFCPYRLRSKRAKSYKRLKLYFERALVECIANSYRYACAITASKYRIPEVLKKQCKLPIPESLLLLNRDDDTVVLLIELICSLQEQLGAFRLAELTALLNKKPTKKSNPKKVIDARN